MNHSRSLLGIRVVLTSVCLLRMFYLQIPEGEFTAVGYAERLGAEQQGTVVQ